MEETLIFDSHVHSDNSPDGDHSITFLGIAAQDLDICGMAITDHCECNVYEEEKYDKSIFQSVFETRKARQVFGNALKICTGIELGEPLQNPAAAKKVLASHPFDFVLCSLHNLTGRQDFYYMDYTEMTDGEIYGLLEEYFKDLWEMAKACDFDSLAHLTYPLRYIVGEQERAISLARFDGLVDEILKALIQRGKALELNTSGLRTGYGVTLPGKRILGRYRQLGGELLTIGSDAHRSDVLATGFPQAFDLLKELGFTRYTYYEKRTPHWIPLG